MKNGRLEVIPYDENEKLNYESIFLLMLKNYIILYYSKRKKKTI